MWSTLKLRMKLEIHLARPLVVLQCCNTAILSVNSFLLPNVAAGVPTAKSVAELQLAAQRGAVHIPCRSTSKYEQLYSRMTTISSKSKE